MNFSKYARVSDIYFSFLGCLVYELDLLRGTSFMAAATAVVVMVMIQGLLHGGVIASLLDGTMTNCLFAHGCAAMTGELNVCYREPVVIGEEMRIRAWITRSLSPLFMLAAELKQGDCVKATATAKFMERP